MRQKVQCKNHNRAVSKVTRWGVKYERVMYYLKYLVLHVYRFFCTGYRERFIIKSVYSMASSSGLMKPGESWGLCDQTPVTPLTSLHAPGARMRWWTPPVAPKNHNCTRSREVSVQKNPNPITTINDTSRKPCVLLLLLHHPEQQRRRSLSSSY